MILKLGIEHYVLKLYTVYINDPELTLTYFTTKTSNLAKLVFIHVLIVGPDIRCAFTGPLVLLFLFLLKHRLWVLVRIYVLEQNYDKMYTPVNPSFTI